MLSFPYSNSKPLTQRCFRKTQHQLSGRNPRRKSLTSRESFHLRNMALRSPREWRLQMFPAQSAGHQGRSAFCPCVLGAIGPPSPAVLVSRLTVTIATLQLPPALQASPGLELASPDLCSSLSNGEKTVGRRKGEASRWPPHTKPHLTV